MVIFTKPIPRPALWGGMLIREYFHYPDFPDGIGQSWSFSAQEGEGQSNLIVGGPYRGQTLIWLWQNQPELFKSSFKRFPVIISLVAPMDDLSLQIHPDDRMAQEAGYPTGKNEAWYFLDAENNASIVYGQTARDETELRERIAKDEWNALMMHLPVHKGDFVYLPAGIVHALKKGSIVYEIQQATDVTYRFYDYHRKDAQGRERPLQPEQAIRCVHYDLSQKDAHPSPASVKLENLTVTTWVDNESFCVRRYALSGPQALRFPRYALMTCVEGAGMADGVPFGIGESFLVTVGSRVRFDGQATLMCTSEGPGGNPVYPV
ncbi:MAG TPA: class I mannose-6-phosphate isomerase [Candidatus Limiplasma sp.]|nr:class I mannose-6-phosphate isomerase [Candidatus Limiplasma sp.]